MLFLICLSLLGVGPPFLPKTGLYLSANNSFTTTIRHQRGFTDVVEEVSSKNRVAIVVESRPLSPTVDMDDSHSVTDAKKVAALFDYDARQHSKFVAIWRKQFSEPEDMPSLTPEEAQQSLHAVATIMKAFFTGIFIPGSFRDDYEELSESLFYSLTPAQWASMSKGELAVSSLSQEQQAAIRKYLMIETTFDLQTTQSILGTEDWLKMLNTDKGDIGTFGTELTQTVPRYRLPTGNKPPYPPYRYLYLGQAPEMMGQLYYGGAIGGTNASVFDAQSKGNKDLFKDKYRPTDRDREAVKELAKLKVTETLSDIVKRQTQRDSRGWVYTVEPGLASKPVQVFGEQYAKPEEIVESCAAVYGLRVVRDESGHTLTITYPFARAAKTEEEVAPLVRGVMPEPVARWLHMRERQEAARTTEAYNARYRAWKDWREKNGKTETDPYDDGYRGPIPAPWDTARAEQWRMKNKERWAKIGKNISETPELALRRFRASVEPRIEKEDGHVLPVTQLTQQERLDLAAYFACSFWSDTGLVLAVDAKPNVVKNLAQAFLKGTLRNAGKADTPARVAFEVGFKKKNEFDMEYTVTGVPMKKPERLSVPLPPPTDEDF